MLKSRQFWFVGAPVVLGLLAAGFVAFDPAAMGGLVGGFLLLLGGAEFLVRGAAALARRLGISSLLVGLTVVAFGTSAPELAAGITAVLDGKSELNIGNVVGSNIANIGLILGGTALVYPISCTLKVVRAEVPLMVAAMLVCIIAMTGGRISRFEGGLLTIGLLLFVWRSFRVGRREGEAAKGAGQELSRELGSERLVSVGGWWLSLVLILIGLAGLVVGAWLLVGSAEKIAVALNVPREIIGLSLVAFGTSLPELATCLIAALRREPDIVVGNILGSNIFNVVCVLGITALVGPITVPDQMMRVDVWVMLGLAVLCLPIMWTGRRITRAEGGALLAAYLAYVVVLYALN